MLINAFNLDTSPVPSVVEGMFPEVGNGWVHGRSSTGKSYAFVTDLALSVANGIPFFGHATKQGVVVVALGEGLQDAGLRIKAKMAHYAEAVAARYQEILAGQGQDAADEYAASQPACTDNSLIIETTPFRIPFENDKPSAEMQQFIASVSVIGPALVIIDAMSDFAGGASISNETSASNYVKGIKHLVTELNCFVLGIGHDTQDGKKMSGNIRFFNAADVMIAVKAQQGEGNVSTVISEKVKYGELFPSFAFTAVQKTWDEPVIDDHGFPTGKTIPVKTHVVMLQDENADGPSLIMPDVASSTLAPVMLPALRDVAKPPAKRNGIRMRTGLTYEERQAQVEKMLSVPCHECGAPETRGCNPVPGSQFSTVAPGTEVHISRAAQQKTAEKVTA